MLGLNQDKLFFFIHYFFTVNFVMRSFHLQFTSAPYVFECSWKTQVAVRKQQQRLIKATADLSISASENDRMQSFKKKHSRIQQHLFKRTK